MLLLSCGSNDNPKNSLTTNRTVEQQKSEGPKFLFENLSYNFGKITQGEQVNCVFNFKNVGSSNLIICDVGTSCGCTSSIFSKEPVLPEKKGTITVTFDSKGKSGEISTHVVVSANTYPANVLLTLYANVVD
jgi:hypothetical protein